MFTFANKKFIENARNEGIEEGKNLGRVKGKEECIEERKQEESKFCIQNIFTQ